jgi:hypothetical protein
MPEKKRYRKTCKDNTFVVRLLDYQHNTWQGEITWLKSNQKEYFRSLLEMLHLIHSSTAVPPQAAAAKEQSFRNDLELLRLIDSATVMPDWAQTAAE